MKSAITFWCSRGISYLSIRVVKASLVKLSLLAVRFEVFTAVTLKNGVFWDVTLCGYCKNRRFGRTQYLAACVGF
jgi:hypothetical protein